MSYEFHSVLIRPPCSTVPSSGLLKSQQMRTDWKGAKLVHKDHQRAEDPALEESPKESGLLTPEETQARPLHYASYWKGGCREVEALSSEGATWRGLGQQVQAALWEVSSWYEKRIFYSENNHSLVQLPPRHSSILSSGWPGHRTSQPGSPSPQQGRRFLQPGLLRVWLWFSDYSESLFGKRIKSQIVSSYLKPYREKPFCFC